jgi:CBS domain containing-hemolysin-like protein
MYKGVPLDEVKGQLRREMLAIVSARDSALARALVATDKKNEKNDEAVTEKHDEVLASAAASLTLIPKQQRALSRRVLRLGSLTGSRSC